jgi:hypothetical protein
LTSDFQHHGWGFGVEFFYKKKKKKKKKKNKSAMGVVEGWPGYWFRDSSCHGYCGQLTIASDNPKCLLCNSQLGRPATFLAVNVFFGPFCQKYFEKENILLLQILCFLK